MSEIADLYVTLRAVTSPFTKAIREAEGSGEAFGKSVGGVRGALTSLGKGTVVAAAGVAAISVKMAGDFQASMLRLKTSAGETGDLIGGKLTGNLKLVSDGILKLAVDTATSTKELSSGMYMIESAGYHGAAGLRVLQAAAEGAKAEGADLSTVGNALTTMMKDYHLSANQATVAMNQLITTVSHGKTTMQDMAGALHAVLPIAAAAHLSFAQVGGAIATMTSHGVSAELASQHLAFMIRSLQAPSNVAATEMASLGLNATDLAQHLGQRGLTGTLDLLMRAILQHMGPSGLVMLHTFNTSQQAAQSLRTEISSMPAALQKLAHAYLAGSVSQKQWTKDLRAMPPVQASLMRQFATTANRAEGFTRALKLNRGASETVSAALKKTTGGAVGLETALQLTGENAKDFNANVKAIGESSQKTGAHVENWGKIQQSFNFKMGQLKEEVQTVAIKLGTLLLPIVMKVVGWFAKHKLAIEALAVVLGGLLVASIVAVTVAIWNMNAALLANPITWIVLAVVAAIALIVAGVIYAAHHFTGFWNVVKAVWAAIESATSAAWDAIKGAVVGAANGLASFFTSIFNAIKTVVLAAWDGIKAATSVTWRVIHTIIIAPLQAIGNVIKAAFNLIGTIVIDTWNIIHAVIFGKTRDVKHAITAFGNDVKAAWKMLWDAVKTAVTVVWHTIDLVVMTTVKSISTGLKAVWHGIEAAATATWHGILSATKATWHGIETATTTAWHAVVGAVSWSVKAIWTGIKAAWRFVVNLTYTEWNMVIHGVSSAISWVYRFVAAIPGNILRILKNVGTLLYTVGRNIVVGLWNGLVSMGSWLWNHVWGWIKDVIPGPIKAVLGISSPSKLMHSYGQFAALGLAHGIKSQYGAVADAASGMAQIVADSTMGGAIGGAFTVTGAGAGRFGISGSGAPVTVVHNETHVHVAGSVLAERELMNVVRKNSLQHNKRNPTNGLSLIPGV